MSKNDGKKNKALHRRLSDILSPDPDAIQTTKLLDKIKPVARAFIQEPVSEIAQYSNKEPSVEVLPYSDVSPYSDISPSSPAAPYHEDTPYSEKVQYPDTAPSSEAVPSINSDTATSEDTVFCESTVSQNSTVSSQKTVQEQSTVLSGITVTNRSTVTLEDTALYESTVLPENTVSLESGVNKLDLEKIDEIKDQHKIDEPTQYSEKVPYYQSTVSPKSTVSRKKTVLPQSTVTPKSGYLEVPNSVADEIAKSLNPFEWAVYFRLFRLSHGWHNETCLVGTQSLMDSTNMSEAQIRKVIKSLQDQGLIQILEVLNTKDIKGTRYKINTVLPQSTVPEKSTVSDQKTVITDNTVLRQQSIKDHDDLLKTDHHQTAHERETMTIYQLITGNKWGRADRVAYQQIAGVPLDQIEKTIREVLTRAPQKPATLAYFVKEILNPSTVNPSAKMGTRARLRAIIERLSQANVGRQYTIGELADDTKLACARDGVQFDNDLFNEIIASRSRSGD